MQQPVTNVEWLANSRQTICVSSLTIVIGETNRAQPAKESTFLKRCANVADALFKIIRFVSYITILLYFVFSSTTCSSKVSPSKSPGLHPGLLSVPCLHALLRASGSREHASFVSTESGRPTVTSPLPVGLRASHFRQGA
jgi:hypothetical protein